jgi:hypothetical protein
MHKKAQISLFFIFGLIFLILLALFFFQKKSSELVKGDLYSEEMGSFQKYFDECALYAILKSNVLNGFVSNKEHYQELIISNVNNCMQPFIESLEEKGFTIKKSPSDSKLEVYDKTLVVSIDYPADISKDAFRFSFTQFTKTFEREVEINLDEIGKLSVSSSDNMARVDFSGKTELYDIYGGRADDFIIVKVTDKREKKGQELEGNLIYCILPIELLPSSPTKICLYPDDLIPGVKDLSKLKISWWNPESNKWGFLETEYKNNCLQATLNYTTCFGIVENDEIFGELMPGESPEESGFYSSLIDAPNPEYNIFPGGYDEIFNRINAEMKGPYILDLNPACAAKAGGTAYCFVGAMKGCDTAVHCMPDKINSMGEREKNILFRHEITHSIQQINDARNSQCGPRPLAKREWGAEYYSGSTYYTFSLGNTKYTAVQLVEYLKENGCTATDDDFLKAAFCETGAYDNLRNKGCLLGKGGTDIAETISA